MRQSFAEIAFTNSVTPLPEVRILKSGKDNYRIHDSLFPAASFGVYLDRFGHLEIVILSVAITVGIELQKPAENKCTGSEWAGDQFGSGGAGNRL